MQEDQNEENQDSEEEWMGDEEEERHSYLAYLELPPAIKELEDGKLKRIFFTKQQAKQLRDYLDDAIDYMDDELDYLSIGMHASTIGFQADGESRPDPTPIDKISIAVWGKEEIR